MEFKQPNEEKKKRFTTKNAFYKLCFAHLEYDAYRNSMRLSLKCFYQFFIGRIDSSQNKKNSVEYLKQTKNEIHQFKIKLEMCLNLKIK